MSDKKISALLALSLISSPLALPAGTHSSTAPSKISSETTSHRASLRRMKRELDYIHPSHANQINAPLPETTAPDQVVGIYGNILYPQDKEMLQEKKLSDWFKAYATDPSAPFPLTEEETKDISLYIINRFPLGTIRRYFTAQVQAHLTSGQPLETALDNAKQETLIRAHFP